jgi:mono/diheme cytochrome c family protein
MIKPVLLLTAAGLLMACQTAATSGETSSTPQPSLNDDPLAFTQAACGGCHAVEYPGLSPNSAAPTFASIANRPGLDGDTLSAWLASAHNYPEVMDFDLDPEQVDLVARQLLKLRSEDYRPVE